MAWSNLSWYILLPTIIDLSCLYGLALLLLHMVFTRNHSSVSRMAGSPLGTINCQLGPVMAASDRFRIRVKGRGGHGAAPHQTVDAIVEAAAVVTALQTVVSRSNVRGAYCCVNVFMPYCHTGVERVLGLWCSVASLTFPVCGIRIPWRQRCSPAAPSTVDTVRLHSTIRSTYIYAHSYHTYIHLSFEVLECICIDIRELSCTSTSV